jgi:hypothetical protein
MPQVMNLDAVVAWLGRFVESFDFTRTGRDQSLGRDIANKIAEGIIERNKRQVDRDGEPWKKNAPAYKEWKELKSGLVDEPNIRTGQMTSQLSLFGRTQIARREITMIMGLDKPPVRSAAPTGHISKQDKNITDTAKAYFAHTGQSRQKIQRRFYAATSGDAVVVVELVQKNMNQYIRSIA